MLHEEEIIIIILQFGRFRIINNPGINEILHFDFLIKIILKLSKRFLLIKIAFKIEKNKYVFI